MLVAAVARRRFVVAHLHLLHKLPARAADQLHQPARRAARPSGSTSSRRASRSSTGGIFGQGLGHGRMTNGQFVPEQPTDFVFSVAGEELGLVGAGLIVVLCGVVLWRALRIARLAQDRFGMLVAVGIVCWFGFQAFENIGMNLGIMPITGLPLPFVSYGGTSMFASMIAIGLLQNVYIRTPR